MQFVRNLWILSWSYLSWIFPKSIAKSAETYFTSTTRIPRPQSENDFYGTAKKYKLSNGIAAFEWGLSSNPLVLLIHGWNGRGTQLGHFINPLIEKNFRVVALDGPAHGDSPGKQTHVREYADFMIEAQKELGPYKAVISHSFGTGCSVIAVASGLQAEKLVLIAGPAKYELMIGYYLKRIKLSPISQKYFYKSLAKKTDLNPKDINIGLIGSKTIAKALIIHDKGDKQVQFKAAEDLKKDWPSAELFPTEGLGHYRILKSKLVIEKAVNFISSAS
jgi:hypothetical protein